jgi:hypothetical protein
MDSISSRMDGRLDSLAAEIKNVNTSLCGDEKHQWEIRMLYKRVESRLGEGCE